MVKKEKKGREKKTTSSGFEKQTIAAKPEGKEEAVVRFDPFRRYMWEISHYPRLSEEEEKRLAIAFKEKGDLEAAYKLVVANLKLVVKISYDYQNEAFRMLDLIQEGNIGLLQAVRQFDPYKGIRLGAYAAWWIRAYILRFVLANWRLVKIGTTQAQRKLFFGLNKERRKLEQEGFLPETKLLAERLNVKEKEVEEMMQRLSSREISLDQPVSEDKKVHFIDKIEEGQHVVSPAYQEQVPPDVALEKEQLKYILRKRIVEFKKLLGERDFFILQNRILSESPFSLEHIGEKYGISKERVRQLEERILSNLKTFVLKAIDHV